MIIALGRCAGLVAWSLLCGPGILFWKELQQRPRMGRLQGSDSMLSSVVGPRTWIPPSWDDEATFLEGLGVVWTFSGPDKADQIHSVT